MRFEGLDLNLLAALEVLLECRSTTETARRLNLSQPTISAALGRLRDYFEDDLLMNVGREMVPTALGEELAPAVTELLNVARFRIIQGEGFDPASSHRCFKILASDYVFDVLLASALAKAARIAPDLRFEISLTGPTGGRLFQKGEIDLMITVPQYLAPDHPSEILFEDVDSVVCWSEGRFRDTIDEKGFLEADFAKAVFGEERRPATVDLYFRERNFDLKTAIEVPSFSALPGAVIGTDRIALMHRRHAKFCQRRYPLSCHPLPVPGPGISEFAQWHQLRRNDGGIAWLLGLLREEAAEMSEADR
ncbi:LysR substrate-binding domain-containing protein [Alteraurantiacibacter aestuarii]|uniref:LysR family transcriptional regulator n=1 Tax=Alteraurantiacibacter aestuarii TaxID=650004 RepID=A0A844ZM45_9SPHN|nr:LysR family transcriptional regulator [Alteraurantiacibacter aestuarii]MXO88176.1 LysR family transcriptional regulator [Alteraurantiacibacter aestuarii]